MCDNEYLITLQTNKIGKINGQTNRKNGDVNTALIDHFELVWTIFCLFVSDDDIMFHRHR